MDISTVEQAAIDELRETAAHGRKMAAYSIDANPRAMSRVLDVLDRALEELASRPDLAAQVLSIPEVLNVPEVNDGFGDQHPGSLIALPDVDRTREAVEGVLAKWEQIATRAEPAFGPQSVSVGFACAEIRKAMDRVR